MKFDICKLTFKSPIHLGERENIREGTDIIVHSDTLFSAFCHCYFLLYGKEKLEEMFNNFIAGSSPFLISSSFPWWENNFYFPVPKNQLSKNKEIKKILFIEKTGFEKLLAGEKIESIINNAKTIPDEESNKPWKINDIPRVGLNRLTNHPGENYFYFGEVSYIKDAGLFFLIDCKDENFKKEFKATFNLMSDEGIGGDRSAGKGLFTKPEFSEIEMNVPDVNSSICLSLYCPKESELSDISKGYYELIERKGYIYSPYGRNLRRRSVRMFTESSVFPGKKEGRIVDVTPDIFEDHRIYKYGCAFTLPCCLEVRNEN